MNPRISVLLPVHNGERYLRAAIESVLKQTYSDFELLVLNDHSSDGSRSIASSLADSDKRIRILDCSGRGLVSALNEGIRIARGDYFARMDSDDVCRPNRFAEQVAFLDRNPSVGVVGSCVNLIDIQGRRVGAYAYFEKDSDIRLAIRSNCGSLFAHPAVMLRADIFRATALCYENFTHAEDYAFWLKIALDWKMHNLRQRLLDYRVHPESVSMKNAETQRLNRQTARRTFLEQAGTRLSPQEKIRFAVARLGVKWRQFCARYMI